MIRNSSGLASALLIGELSDATPFLSVVVKGTFELRRGTGPARLRPTEAQLPIFDSDQPYDPKNPAGALKFESDRVPFKPRTDIVLVGQAYAPLGRPVKSLDVQITVGEKRKVLRVFGDRQWSFSAERDPAPVVAGPVEFRSMPLTYERAFGGIDKLAGTRPDEPQFRPWCERNFLGRGFCGARTTASIHGRALPNVEDPLDLVRAWDSRPSPAGCGFFPRNSRPRSDFFGTFGERWQAERAPRMPDDFRFDCYNGADPSLQVAPYLVGNEPVLLSNVSATEAHLETTLPCLEPVVAVTGAAGFQELTARLDTVVFIPDESIFYQVWRATIAISKPDASDIREVRLATTALARRDPFNSGSST